MLAATREKRANAGNRMSSYVDSEDEGEGDESSGSEYKAFQEESGTGLLEDSESEEEVEADQTVSKSGTKSRRLECPAYSKIVMKHKTKSTAWVYFGLPGDENDKVISDDIAICRLCKTAVSYKSSCTTNLFSHLKTYHPLQYSETYLKSKNQQIYNTEEPTNSGDVSLCSEAGRSNNFDESPKRTSKRRSVSSGLQVSEKQSPTETEDSNSFDETPRQGIKRRKLIKEALVVDRQSAICITDSITKFLATTMQSYYIVEEKSFIEMIQALNPFYKLPSRKYFSNTAVPELYLDLKEKIKRELASINNNEISITTECWTSIENTSFIAVTAHFISTDWQQKSACLACAYFEDDHDFNSISDVLKNILADWDINLGNVASCTTDNATKMLKAIQELGLSYVHVSCFGHNVNNAVNRSLELPALKRSIARLKKLQNTIAMNWKMQRDLRKAQESLQMNLKKLPFANPTRWCSTVKLASYFLTNEEAICKMLLDYPNKKYLMLEESEISALQNFVTGTELLENITKSLSGEEYIIASSILPLYKKIRDNLQCSESHVGLLAEIKAEILNSLKKYEVEPLKSLLRLSTLCDPRFRNLMDSREETKILAIEKMSEIYRNLPSGTSVTVKHDETKKEKKSLFAKLFESSDCSPNSTASSPTFQAEEELEKYLSMPKVDFEQNPLSWWKLNHKSFPSLKVLAKKYLTIQGSSVISNQVFGTRENVFNKQRNLLLPKNAEMQVFISHNRAYIY